MLPPERLLEKSPTDDTHCLSVQVHSYWSHYVMRQFRNLSNIRSICCAKGKTIHISSVFHCIVLLCASKLRKSSLVLRTQ